MFEKAGQNSNRSTYGTAALSGLKKVSQHAGKSPLPDLDEWMRFRRPGGQAWQLISKRIVSCDLQSNAEQVEICRRTRNGSPTYPRELPECWAPRRAGRDPARPAGFAIPARAMRPARWSIDISS